MSGYDFEEYREQLDQSQYYGDIRNTGWHDDAVYEKFSDAEYARRHKVTREKMAGLGLDCIIVPGGNNYRSMGQGLVWLTGHWDKRAMANYAIFPMEGDPTVIVGMGGSHAEAFRVAASVSDLRPPPGGNFAAAFVERFKELGLEESRIGIVSSASEGRTAESLPARYYLYLLENLPKAEFVFVDKFFHELLFRHSEEEVVFMRKAGALLDRAMQAMAERAAVGVTEAQLEAAAVHAMMDGGGYPHLHIIAITSMENPNAVFGNPRPSLKALKEGDVIVSELGAMYQGASAQSGNPIVLGEPTPFVHDFFYEVVFPGYKLMEAALQPGNTMEDVRKAGGLFFREKGHQSRPLHIHCIDIVTDGPKMGPDWVHHDGYDEVLQPGMAIMLEPCPITKDGNFGLFLGRTYIITEDGNECLSKYPLELTVVNP
jgi:Xaa-Pro aminopeptidase